MNEVRRVVESFPLYDSVIISNSIAENNKLGFFNNYAEMGNENKITFFDQRKQTDTDLAYCNLDAKERFPYGFEAYSFGITFQGPAVGDIASVPDSEQPPTTADMIFSNWSEGQIFAFELPKHCGVKIRLEQNDVLESNCMFSPSGVAALGQSNPSGDFGTVAGNIAGPHSSGNTGGFGLPQLTNRWPFPKPLVIPANSVFSVELEFSQLGKELLQAMYGPRNWIFGELDTSGESPEVLPISHPAISMIQVSLVGVRHIQQRGEETAQVPGR